MRFILSSSLKFWVLVDGAHLGGNANNGTNDGFAYVNSNNTPSNANANIGSRLYWKVLTNRFLPLYLKSRSIQLETVSFRKCSYKRSSVLGIALHSLDTNTLALAKKRPLVG